MSSKICKSFLEHKDFKEWFGRGVKGCDDDTMITFQYEYFDNPDDQEWEYSIKWKIIEVDYEPFRKMNYRKICRINTSSPMALFMCGWNEYDESSSDEDYEETSHLVKEKPKDDFDYSFYTVKQDWGEGVGIQHDEVMDIPYGEVDVDGKIIQGADGCVSDYDEKTIKIMKTKCFIEDDPEDKPKKFKIKIKKRTNKNMILTMIKENQYKDNFYKKVLQLCKKYKL